MLHHQSGLRTTGGKLRSYSSDENLKRDFTQVAATIWGGLLRVSDPGGPIRVVSAIYENFKIIGLPIAGTNLAILLTVEVKIDSYALKDRITEFMKYWVT